LNLYQFFNHIAVLCCCYFPLKCKNSVVLSLLIRSDFWKYCPNYTGWSRKHCCTLFWKRLTSIERWRRLGKIWTPDMGKKGSRGALCVPLWVWAESWEIYLAQRISFSFQLTFLCG